MSTVRAALTGLSRKVKYNHEFLLPKMSYLLLDGFLSPIHLFRLPATW